MKVGDTLIDGRRWTLIPELQGADIQDKSSCQVTPLDAESNDHATFRSASWLPRIESRSDATPSANHAQATKNRWAEINLGAFTAYTDQSVLC